MTPFIDPSCLATASLLLAVAIRDFFPQAQILNRGQEGFTFYCEAELPDYPDEKALLEHLERSIKRSIAENDEITVKEMLSSNAELFLAHVESPDSERNLKATQLAIIVQIGDYHFAESKPLLSATGEIKGFRLCSAEKMPEGFFKIRGVAVCDKKLLKQAVERFKRAQVSAHRQALTDRELALLSPWIWLPKGLAWHKALSSFFLERMDNLSPIWVASHLSAAAHLTYAAELMKQGRSLPLLISEQNREPGIASSEENTLLKATRLSGDLNSLICHHKSAAQQLTSSLQLIDKTYKMLSIEYRWVWRLAKPKGVPNGTAWHLQGQKFEQAIADCQLQGYAGESFFGQRGPRLEVEIFDRWGRCWPIAFAESLVSFDKGEDFTTVAMVLQYSLVQSVERLQALLLEHYAEGFPFWLAPEQLRLLTVSREEIDYASQLLEEAKAQGLRAYLDSSELPLSHKIFSGERASVPHIAIIGAKEAREGTVTLRRERATLSKQELWNITSIRGVEKST